MATFDPTGAKTMITAPQYDFRPLPYLVSLGFVGAATAGIFFGAGFLLLAPPLGVGSSADPVPPILALEAHEVPPPAINETASGSSMASAAEKTAASPMSGAPSNRRRQGSRQRRLMQDSSRQPGAPILKGSGSFCINAKYPRGIGPNYGDLMPAPDRIQAAVFTVLQTSMSDT